MDFKTYPGCPSFIASPSGDIFFVTASGLVRPANAAIDQDGYKVVKVTRGGSTRNFKVHRIICELYVAGHEEGMVVDHIDAQRTNNAAHNLRWVTAKANATTAASVYNRIHIKFSDEDVANVRAMRERGVSFRLIAEATGVSRPHVRKICSGQRRPQHKESPWSLDQ